MSDIRARKALPERILENMALYVGCAAGVLIVDAKSDLSLYKESSYLPQSSCCSSTDSSKDAMAGLAALDFNEWVGSFQIYAVKPGAEA
ncbi:hypothetical protein BBP40_005944 [Aspergillus hancockii]|nr:hypothetical protein BBP40_005944 [Aspergillus hancockii]